jgi:hypothetical protein
MVGLAGVSGILQFVIQFFESPPHGLVTDGIGDLELNHPASKQPQRPAGVPFGRRAETQSNHTSLPSPLSPLEVWVCVGL